MSNPSLEGSGPTSTANDPGAGSFRVTCAACGRLHEPVDPLTMNPVCPPCAGRGEALHIGRALELTGKQIDRAVGREAPGSFALGYLEGGRFVAFYVGRADRDLNACLHAWLGVDSHSARYAPSARAAYGSQRRRASAPFRAPSPLPVGVAVDGRYTHFECRYAASAQAAFQDECRHYHELGGSHGLDNEAHPSPPSGSTWLCPVLESHPS